MTKSKRLKFTLKTSHLQEPMTVSNYVSSHGTGWQILCFGDVSADRGRWRQGKRHHWSKFQARVWMAMGGCTHPPLPPSPHFKGQLGSHSADLPSAFAVAHVFETACSYYCISPLFQIRHFPSNTIFALNIWGMQISLFTHAWKSSDSAVFPG